MWRESKRRRIRSCRRPYCRYSLSGQQRSRFSVFRFPFSENCQWRWRARRQWSIRAQACRMRGIGIGWCGDLCQLLFVFTSRKRLGGEQTRRHLRRLSRRHGRRARSWCPQGALTAHAERCSVHVCRHGRLWSLHSISWRLVAGCHSSLSMARRAVFIVFNVFNEINCYAGDSTVWARLGHWPPWGRQEHVTWFHMQLLLVSVGKVSMVRKGFWNYFS